MVTVTVAACETATASELNTQMTATPAVTNHTTGFTTTLLNASPSIARSRQVELDSRVRSLVLGGSMQGSVHGPERGHISRGDFLKRAGFLGVAATVPSGVLARDTPSQATAPQVVEREALESFTSTEGDIIEAFVARLIPTDATGPGAREARVARFIDRALARALMHHRETYSINLAALDAHARATHGAGFASLSEAQQDAVLTNMEANVATGFSPNSRAFFNLVREHTLQGMFGDPFHGGNADGIGWRLIRYPGVSLDIKARDQRLDVTNRASTYKMSTYDFDLFKRGTRRSASHGH
jgi:gluconate 2-dehydrogenase gamma chain